MREAQWTLAGDPPNIPPMNRSNRSRRIVALLAAYVVALQALLLPLSVAAGAGFDTGICVSSSSEGSPHPAGHDDGCGCAAGCGMQCCAQSLAAPPQITVALGFTRAEALIPALALEPAARPSPKGPQVPRAPPAA
jgi:hypothetical protein